jgi:hypothetical protein
LGKNYLEAGMSEIKLERKIKKIKNPANIQEALYASGPSVLMRAFELDPTVKVLIRSGLKVVKLIASEIKKNGLSLNPISLSCFAYILQMISPDVAAATVRPLFIEAMKKPDPYFVYFAAHVLRQDMKLPTVPNDPEYTYGELQETLAWVERLIRTEKGGENA